MIIGREINFSVISAITEIIRNRYRYQFSLKLQDLNFRPNKGNSTFMIKEENRVNPIKNHLFKST